MSTPPLVEQFYGRIWNAGDEAAAEELLTSDFAFRGSLGVETRGRGPFLEYVRSVRGSLASYRCEVVACVASGSEAFARMRFSGAHVGVFRGFAPTRKPVAWDGAALFTFRDGAISNLWVLGDLAGLDDVLRRNADEPAAEIPSGESRRTMNCPSCESKSLVAGTLDAGLPAHTCPKCTGYWVGAESYRAWLGRRRESANIAEPTDPSVTLADSQHARLCPSCGRIMLRYRVGHGVEFFLDTCGMCNGIWFDRNEWAALKGRNLHDDLHLIFTEPWQAEVHRAEARKHLEALYRKRYGADYDEVVRVRTWLQGHPQKASILAFLADPEPFEA